MTDLEGSTAHLRALGGDYGTVLAQHHAIIRKALESEAGVEVGSEGDSFAAVFPGSAAALRAAVAVQRGLLDADWPDSPWRVRMAVHSGPVEMTEAGAVGMCLHETARIRAVVHGGQIVVSGRAWEAIDDPVPAEIRMIDLGRHTVRDFDSPVRLYQLAAPGLRTDFPALRTMAARGIPPARTSFVGRTSELDELSAKLSAARLVTVTGPGGSGKTRLAYEVARRVEIDDVVVVELAGLRDASQVDAEVARRVGARQADDIIPTIGARDLLLVVDNCEHLMPRVALLMSELLTACEGLVVLATSREPLGVAGEVVWPTPQLRSDDAMTLFKARAARDLEDESLVRAACDRLGRMPLAIELAVARVRSVPLAELVRRLEDQLRLLTSGARDVPRQQALRATLDWSYDLLSDNEQVVFRRLGVFAGGFTLDAAEAVAASVDDVDVLDAIDGLVLKSLLELSTDEDRYRMLEPVRQYAVDHLRATGDDHSTCERHTLWAARFAADGSRNLVTSQQRYWTSVLDGERDNFGAAIGWALDNDRPSLAATIVSSLAWYWFSSGRNEGYIWVPRVMAVLDSLGRKDRAKALLAAGITYCDFTDDDRPLEWLDEASNIFRQLGHERGLGSVLFWLGRAASGRGDARAESVFADCAAVNERIGDLFGWGWSMSWLGSFARTRGEFDEAEAIGWQVMARCSDISHVVGAAWNELAQVASDRGEPDKAMDYSSRALLKFRELGDRWQIAMSLYFRAGFALDLSVDASASCTVETLTQLRELGADPDIKAQLPFAAGLLLAAGRREDAATAAGAAGVDTHAKPPRYLPLNLRDMMNAVWALPTEPDLTPSLERGRRLGIRDAADATIEWLNRAYPGSVTTS
jgi:predicted ATPase